MFYLLIAFTVQKKIARNYFATCISVEPHRSFSTRSVGSCSYTICSLFFSGTILRIFSYFLFRSIADSGFSAINEVYPFL